MSDNNQAPEVQLTIKEIHDRLCPTCQLALKKLLGEKVAEKIIQG